MENEQLCAAILENLHEAVIITDNNRYVKFMNHAAESLTGWKQDEAYGKDLVEVFEIMNDPACSPAKSPVAKILWEGVTKGISAGLSSDLVITGKYGSQTTIECSASLIRDDKDNMKGVTFIFRDVTERKQLDYLKDSSYQQQLIQAGKMVSLGTLVSGVAHEINNPNNFIMLNAPILWDVWKDIMPIIEKYYEENGDFDMGGLKYSEMRGYIPQLFSGICEGAKRIKWIVSDLKDFARQGTSNMDENVDTNSVVQSAVTIISNQIRKATKNLLVEYGDNIPALKGNYQRLEQVVINIILNACQAIDEPKNGIFISTFYNKTARAVMIKIKDEGKGIPANILGRITEPFFTTKRNSGGTGLGLAVSSGIIKDHKGELKFSSVEDKGTTVTVLLPVLKSEDN